MSITLLYFSHFCEGFSVNICENLQKGKAVPSWFCNDVKTKWKRGMTARKTSKGYPKKIIFVLLFLPGYHFMKHASFSIRFAPGPWCSLKQHIIPSNVLENIQSGKSSPLTFCSARDAGKSLPIWCKFHTPLLQHYERVDILPNSTIKNSNGAKWALNVFLRAI